MKSWKTKKNKHFGADVHDLKARMSNDPRGFKKFGQKTFGLNFRSLTLDGSPWVCGLIIWLNPGSLPLVAHLLNTQLSGAGGAFFQLLNFSFSVHMLELARVLARFWQEPKTTLLSIVYCEPPKKPLEPRKLKVAQKRQKSDFPGLPQSDSKVTLDRKSHFSGSFARGRCRRGRSEIPHCCSKLLLFALVL